MYFYFQVSLAAQTLSASVATALEFLKSLGYEAFQDSDATILFIQTIDHVFDILNSRTPMASSYKRPVSLNNLAHIKNFLEFADNFLMSLKVRGKTLISSNQQTGFIGFVFCIRSFMNVSEELLTDEEKPFKYVMGYKFSQDHLELLFNAIRGALGWNNNPTPKQFRYIIRRLHARVGIFPDSTGNCLNFTPQLDNIPPEVVESSENIRLPSSPYLSNIISYISGFVAKKFLQRDTCPECRASVLASPLHSNFSNEDNCFIRLKDNGGLLTPSSDVVKVLKHCEAIFTTLELRQQKPEHVYYRVLNALPVGVFGSLHMVEEDHRCKVIRSLVYLYCNLRCHHVARQRYLSNLQYKRSQLTKYVHFLSQ